MIRPFVLATLLFAVVPAARADVLVEVGNGDKITGTLDPPGETETFRVRVPKGAAISVKGKAATKGLVLDVALADPDGAPIAHASAAAPSLKGVVAASSGLFKVTVKSDGGAVKGNYSLSITWKSPKSFTASATLDAAGASELPFAVDAGAAASLSVKPAKGSAASAALVELTLPDQSVVPLGGTSASRTLAAGDHVLAFRNDGPGAGAVAATVKLKIPKPQKRKIALTSSVIGAGGADGDAAFAQVVGEGGATVTFPPLPPGEPGAAISGSSVEIPAGALGAGTSIVIATAPDLSLPPPLSSGGPPVHFGPDGLSFTSSDKEARVTISIPYDPVLTEAQAATLLVYTRDAKGKVTAVPGPYTIDAASHTISFPSSHFSAYEAAGIDLVGEVEMFTTGNVTTPEDVCLAFDDDNPELPIFYFVAEGGARTVAGLRISTTSLLYTRERWAGGGSLTADDGTVSRLEFLFPGPVVSAHALSDGRVFVATATQVYRIDDAGLVTRIAGTGSVGDSGDGEVATGALFTSITSVIADEDGNIFIADAGAHRIRTIPDGGGNVIQPFAGIGTAGIGEDGEALTQTRFVGPTDMEFSENGGLYVTDGARVRLLERGDPDMNVTIAGSLTGETGNSGDGGPLLSARFQSLSGIARYLDPFSPLTFSLVVCDAADHTVRVLDRAADRVVLAVGEHGASGNAPDVSPATGRISMPTGVFGGAGSIVFADRGNGKIRTRFLLQ